MADNKTQILITAKDDTRAAIASAKAGLQSITAAAARLPLVGTALAGAFSATALTAGIKSVIDGADQLQKASQKYGISVEQLSALGYAGKLAGVGLEAIGTGLKKLSVNMVDAAAGTGEAKEAFKALGISVKESDGTLKSSEAVLGEIADKFAGMEDGAGKTALAVKLFGRAGAEMIPLLNQGSKGLAEMREEAERLGAIVGGDLAKASEEFNDNLSRLGATTEAFGISIANTVLPSMNKLLEGFVANIKAAGGFWEAVKLLGSFSPFKNNQQSIREYSTELEKIEQRMAYGIPDAERKGLEASAAALKKRISYLKEIAAYEANSGIKGARGRLDSKDIGPATLAQAPGLSGDVAKKATASLATVEDYADRIRKAVGSAINDNDITRAREYADTIAELDRIFFDTGLDAEIYDAALDKITKSTSKASDEQRRLNELLAATPSANMEKLRDDMILLSQAFEEGRIGVEKYFEAVATRLPKVEEVLDEMTEFTRQAARNMQDAMGNFFFDVMQGKFDDMAGNFKKTIDRMVAELMASQLMKFLTGDFGKTGVLGGFVGDLLGGMFGGGKAAGGPVAAGTPYLVGEQGPEIFMPRQSGTIIPNGAAGAVAVYNTFTITGAVDQRSQQQIAAEVGASVDRAMRRNR